MHDVLQEVVRITLVMVPGRPRLDLPALHEYLGDRRRAQMASVPGLHGRLPESHQQAVAVKLGERLGLPELNDAMHPSMYLRGQCPPQGTPLETPFPVHRRCFGQCRGESVGRSHGSERDQQLVVVHHPTRGSLVCHVLNIDRVETIEAAENCWIGTVPSHIVEEASHQVQEGAGCTKNSGRRRVDSSELEVVGPRGPSCPGGSRALYRSSPPRLRTRGR
jgi:hypothetical protein